MNTNNNIRKEAVKHPNMSDDTTRVSLDDKKHPVVYVKLLTEAHVKTAMKLNRDDKREKITSLNNLFAVALQQTHYELKSDALSDEELNNGTGYYDPLCDAIFLDEDGQPVQSTKTVRYLDEKTSRRLYIVVVYPGMNVIIHDRYSFTEDGFGGTLVCTSGVNYAKQAIGMEPCWSEDCMYDFVMACRMFGFEYDRRSNEVYMPRERKENAFEIGLRGSQELTHRIRKMQGAKGE